MIAGTWNDTSSSGCDRLAHPGPQGSGVADDFARHWPLDHSQGALDEVERITI
jgi:hypothetical protein